MTLWTNLVEAAGDYVGKQHHQHRVFALAGFIVWMLAWPLADKYRRYGTLIALLGTIALCVGFMLAIR